MSKRLAQKGFILPFIVVLVLMLIVAIGAFYLGKSGAYLPLKKNSAPIDTSTTNETLSWKKYTSPQANLSMEYPSTWTLTPPVVDCEHCTLSVKGSGGVVTIDWSPIAGWNGRLEEFTTPNIRLKNEIIEARKYQNLDGSESWTINKDFYPAGGAFRIIADANNPTTTNRDLILKILSTLILKPF